MGKVTSRTALTVAADADILHVVDVSDTTDSPQGTSKKSTLRVIRKAMGDIYEAELSITTAQVLALNTTPLAIVAAPGAGYAIELLSASMSLTFSSIAYATNTTVQLIADTATVSQLAFNSAVLSSASTTFNTVGKSASAGLNVIANKAIQVKVATGDPTAGNSGIKVYVLYRIITV